MNISEVLDVKNGRIDVQDIFFFERVGVTEAGKVQGRFRGAGHEPKIMERLRVSGISLDPAIFQQVIEINM